MSATHLALFGAGVASFLAPCVVPLVPAYVGMLTAQSAASPGAVTRGAVLFVAGFAAVFVALGSLAGLLGSGLASLQTWLTRSGGVLIAGFGLLMLAAHRGRLGWEVRLPASVRGRGAVGRPLVMGVAFGAAWTPCVGPLLGAALVVAARGANPWSGGSLLLAYALGVGAPFLAAALAVAAHPSLLARLRRWSHHVQPVAGVALVLLGVLLAAGAYDRLLGPLARLVPGSS